MIFKKFDKENKYISIFDDKSGFYIRTGVLDKDGKDTGIDSFMASMPELIDIGIMGSCYHGRSGLCVKSGIQCYQNGLELDKPNMSLVDFKFIIRQIKSMTYQVALGGRGDPNKHENFKEIVEHCRKNNIVPNYTTSGLNLTNEEVNITKENCGAVAVSWYRQEYTYRAIELFLKAGVKTNIHYVLGNNSINEAIKKLKENDFPKGINAVIFLLHKPVGLGKETNVLNIKNLKVKEFYRFIDDAKFDFKIGFDSCNVPALINFNKNINKDTFDTCEAARWSCYITSDLKITPCSFDNQELKYAIDLKENSIKEAWNSSKFEHFRNYFRKSCLSCKDRIDCLGGCPLKKEIVLCDRKERIICED